ncbi:hypothetical protein MHU86_21618 [Fragilaria crotonensis]|nr:hypothetical protein MHU86_21618 [Fragilaria crotonensis]
MREWFEDSSSEGEAPIRVRLMKNGGKKKSTSSMSLKKERKRKVELDKEKKIEQMREIRVVVKLELKNFTSSKGTLTAHVACGFSKSDGLSASRRCNKKGKQKVNNWRQRPVRSGVFQRTLPGELSRVIIVATKVRSVPTGDAKVKKTRTLKAVKATKQIIRETEGLDVDLLRAGRRSWKTVKAARKTLKESGALSGPLLRQHPSLALASHNQVANVIAKCLPLQSVEAFL